MKELELFSRKWTVKKREQKRGGEAHLVEGVRVLNDKEVTLNRVNQNKGGFPFHTRNRKRRSEQK